MASRSPLSRVLVHGLIDQCGLASGARVIVAVSGGPDSTGLAVLAAAVSQKRTPAVIDPIIAHIDHGLRAESLAEAGMVERLADRIALPFLQRRVKVEPSGNGVAAAARDARYAALTEMAREQDAAAVLCAHHADDQAETILLGLARGTGVAGLRGMPAVRRLAPGIVLARPMLQTPGSELVELCAACGLETCHDPGNADPASPRAVVRHEVLPVLNRIHAGAAGRIAAVAAELAVDEESISRTRWSRASLASLSAAVRASTIRKAAITLDPAASSCPRSHWHAIAEMITARTTESRTVAITSLVDVHVGSKDTSLEMKKS